MNARKSRARRASAALLCVVAQTACGVDNPELAPIIDVPPASSEAHPYAGLDSLLLAVARAGEPISLAETLIESGQPLAIEEVPFGDDLVIHLTGRAGGFDVVYGRTCAFAFTPDVRPPDDEPHLFLSRIVKWGPSATPAVATRVGGHGYALPDGRAVFVGGASQAGDVAVERFDPQTGAFVALAAEPQVRSGATLTPLADGRAIRVGGVPTDGAGDPSPIIEVLDPRPGTAPAAQIDTHDGPRVRAHAAVALVDGSVVVVGGEAQDAAGAPLAVTAQAWSLQFGAGNVLEPPRALAPMTQARAGHALTRLGDELGADVLITGGVDADGEPVPDAELYRPLREAFEPVGAALITPRRDHIAVRLPGGFVLIVGGVAPDPMTGTPTPVAALELYDPFQGRFTPAGTLPDSAGLTEMTVTTLPDGRILLAGGRDSVGQPVATTLIARLDPIGGQIDVSATDALAVPRAGHIAVPLCDGTILVTGGTDTPGEFGSERYNPPVEGRR